MALKIVGSYGKFVSEKPIVVLLISLMFTALMIFGLTQLGTTGSSQEDLLPEGIDVIAALDIFNDEFGGSQSAMIAVKVDSSYPGSDEPATVLDPRVVAYIDILSQKAEHIDYATGVSSISTLVRNTNNGELSHSLNEIKQLTNTPVTRSYISEDETIALIRISLREEASNHAEDIAKEVTQLIETSSEKPAGITVEPAGQLLSDPIIQELIGPDTAKTGMFSLVGIGLILIIMFRSFKNAALPLTTVLFGVLWALGFVGLIGMGISPTTSGVISMIMGIGIDFGIQIMTRFKYELRSSEKKKAMQKTIEGVFMPMATTTLAALIGFQAMTLGQLKMMGELGTIMSFGVAGSMLAALTIVPSLLIIFEKGGKNY